MTATTKRTANGTANIWGITPQDAKNISFYMLAGKLSAKTIYQQACGERTLQPYVRKAIADYADFKVTAKTTYEEIMRSGYERWKACGFNDEKAIDDEVMNQENPEVVAWENRDLSPEQKADNRKLNLVY